MGEHDEWYDPIEDAEQKAEYAREAAMDTFYEKHPPQVLNIRIQMDLAAGLWFEHVIQSDDHGETVDDLESSHDLDEFMAIVKGWLKKKWDLYVKSQQGPGRRFPSQKYSQLDVTRGIAHYRDGHSEFMRFSRYSREHNVQSFMLLTFTGERAT